MSVTIRNAAPQGLLTGIQDLSGRDLPLSPEQVPQHLPYLFLFTERGRLSPELVVGNSLTSNYGTRSFDYRDIYANHQTVIANTVNGNANALMVQRLKPTDAPDPATIVFWLDLLSTDVEQYQRDEFGDLVLSDSGQPVLTGGTVSGYHGRWEVQALPAGTDIKALKSKAGQLTDTNGQSVMYPMFAAQVADFGAYGNRLGIRMWAPNITSSVPVDEDLVLDELAYLYRLQFVERPERSTVANVTRTVNGEQYVEFNLKEGSINSKTDTELFVDDVVMSNYSVNEPGQAIIDSPFGEFYVYHDNVKTILGDLYTAEKAVSNIAEGDGAEYIINMLTGIDYMGRPYQSYRVLGPSADGLLFTDSTTHYAQGGGDGTMDFAMFDQLVANEMANFGQLEYPLEDDATYPMSVFYDSGFSISTKRAMLTPLGVRKDLGVIVATQDVSQAQNTGSEDSSVAVALRAAARQYPESEIYGTPVCRVMIVAQSGYLVNSQYKGLLPLTVDIADKLSRYAGASNGRYSNTNSPDVSPNNQIAMFKGVNATWKPATSRNRDWANGLVWCQAYDRRSLFYPAYQTVYDDDTSVLNSLMNMLIMIECEKVCQRVWRDLTGNTKLSRAQFIERSNALITERTSGRFDGRVVIRPETYFSPSDDQRGYSWSCKCHVYANNMQTVGVFTVTANRMEDL